MGRTEDRQDNLTIVRNAFWMLLTEAQNYIVTSQGISLEYD